MKSARPGSVGAFEGLVAGAGFGETCALTTPNMTWVPKTAIAHSEITTYKDGRWGRHEYSRWPQLFDIHAFHIHCIPREDAAKRPADILWRTFYDADWKPYDCGIVGLGYIDADITDELVTVADDIIASYERCAETHKDDDSQGQFIVACLRNTLDRFRLLPAVQQVAIALAAHVQRLTLELCGMIEWLTVVRIRVNSQRDHRRSVLEVVGAITADPSVVQMLYQAGVPVWFEQHITPRLVVYRVVSPLDVPPTFSSVPSYPRLVLAKRDLSGALNMPGEWMRAMGAMVRRQLCVARVPALLEEEEKQTLPPAKRPREGAVRAGEDDFTIGPARRVFLVRPSREVKTLGHDLRGSPSASQPGGGAPGKPSRRTRARHLKKSALAGGDPPAGPDRGSWPPVGPSRQFVSSQIVVVPDSWANALSEISPLSQPQRSVRYYFAPPWLLDSLDGSDVTPEKSARYMHQWASIRKFCGVRLFDHTVAGRPLTISEWRDALWGDYDVQEPPVGDSGPPTDRAKRRRELHVNLRALFGKVAFLPSYDVKAAPEVGEKIVTLDVAQHDTRLHQMMIWEAHETNWRCELLALDALMVGSDEWNELDRWMRESLISRIWGPQTSGLDVLPSLSVSDHFCWWAPGEDGWSECRWFLYGFTEMLQRWPGCPETLRGAHARVTECDGQEYGRISEAAVKFYVRTFVDKYERLPVPPVRLPSSSPVPNG